MPYRPLARLFSVVVGALDHSLAAEVVDDERAFSHQISVPSGGGAPFNSAPSGQLFGTVATVFALVSLHPVGARPSRIRVAIPAARRIARRKGWGTISSKLTRSARERKRSASSQRAT